MRKPHILDFEASGLAPESYPIQVAWSLADGTIESWFIKPEVDWTHWDYDAQEIHGIPRPLLNDVGKPARWVAKRINEQLAGQVVYTDAPDYDGIWFNRLFASAGIKPACRLDDFWKLTPRYMAVAKIHECIEQAELHRGGRAHLADNDVRYLLALWAITNGAKP